MRQNEPDDFWRAALEVNSDGVDGVDDAEEYDPTEEDDALVEIDDVEEEGEGSDTPQLPCLATRPARARSATRLAPQGGVAGDEVDHEHGLVGNKKAQMDPSLSA